MGAVFISYRRGDSEGQARALSLELEHFLGKDSVFMDVDSIALGRDFRQVLQQRLETCDIMLVLIGPNWLEARDPGGNRRLESPTDFVHQEIATALKRNIAVIPVLLQGAGMPKPESMPEDLKDLAFRNGFELSHIRWESDVRELTKRLGLITGQTGTYAVPKPTVPSPVPAPVQAPAKPPVSPDSAPPASTRKPVLPWIAAGALLVVAAFLAWMYFSRGQFPGSPPAPATGNTASGPEPASASRARSEREPRPEPRPQTGVPPATAVPPLTATAASATPAASAQPIPNQAANQPFTGYHHLTSMYMEPQTKCLESGDGSGPAHMNQCGNYSGQLWTIQPAANGYYLLESMFQARNNRCLDSGTLQSTASMTACTTSPGQQWKLVPSTSPGYYRLQSQGTEAQNGCLESSNGASPSKMNACTTVSGQFWKVLEQ